MTAVSSMGTGEKAADTLSEKVLNRECLLLEQQLTCYNIFNKKGLSPQSKSKYDSLLVIL